MSENRASLLIGLAMRAGRVSGGEYQAERALKTCEAGLVILAGDASANTAKKFSDMAAWRHIPVIRYQNKEELGRIIGKGERAVLAITDRKLAENIQQLITEQTGKVVGDVGEYQNS